MLTPSGTVWSFKLNEGVPFHKGWGEVTTDDYIFSSTDHVAEGGISSLLGTVKRTFHAEGGGMTKIDDYRFEVDTVTPQFDMLSFGTAVPTTNMTVSKKQWEQEGEDVAMFSGVGIGPWELEDSVTGQTGHSQQWKITTAEPLISPNW